MAITRISPAEAAAKMLEGLTYVDVRTAEEFAEGHPDGAVNVPWPDPAFLTAMDALFTKADPKIVLGCRANDRSRRAAEALVAAGWGPIFEQRAGWAGVRDAFGTVTEIGWAHAGLPVATGHGKARP